MQSLDMPQIDLPSLDVFDEDKIFKIPAAGEFMPPLDGAAFVPGARATHMRDRDYVVGLVLRGTPRAYPGWLIDNYHLVNDQVDGEHYSIHFCENCGYASAFWTTVAGLDGRTFEFRLDGAYNGGMMPCDQDESNWSPVDGVALSGPYRGLTLTRIPTFVTTWREWLELHPSTEVAVWTHPTHRDGRHGHGDTDAPGIPGLEPYFEISIPNGPLDIRLPENQLVLGVNLPGGLKAYPINEVRRNGCVVHETLADRNIVVLNSPHSSLTGAYLSELNGQELTFRAEAGVIRDMNTSSVWTADGRCHSGPLCEQQLEPVTFVQIEWHSWVCYHPSTEIFQSANTGQSSALVLDSDFEAVFTALRKAQRYVGDIDSVFENWLPNAAERGYTANVGGYRLRFFRFPTAADAADFRRAFPHSFQIGRYAVESEPPLSARFKDIGNMRPVPDNQIPWSPYVSDDGFIGLIADALGPELPRDAIEADVPIAAILEAYDDADLPVIKTSEAPNRVPMMMYEHVLPVGARKGFSVRINREEFALFHFQTHERAAEYASQQGRAIADGRFVLKSDPLQYILGHPVKAVNLPDDEISWSEQLQDQKFVDIFKNAIAK